MSYERKHRLRPPPRWLFAWPGTRTAACLASPVAVGLWRPKGNRWGTLRLTTTGRRTSAARCVILGYLKDGPNMVTLAMNGWADG